MKISVCILNYNCPEITDRLFDQLSEKIKIEHNLYVIDNGSDSDKTSKHTTHRLDVNTRLTGGMNKCLDVSKGSDAVWLLTNDVGIVSANDPLETMFNKLDEKIGVIHPSLIKPVDNYAFPWMLTDTKKTGLVRGVSMVDIICPLYTAKALDKLNWEFDRRFIYGWGIDYDSCYITRKAGLDICVDFDVVVTHQTSVTYDSGRDKEFKNRNEYYNKALVNMQQELELKYGKDWARLVV